MKITKKPLSKQIRGIGQMSNGNLGFHLNNGLVLKRWHLAQLKKLFGIFFFMLKIHQILLFIV